MPPLRRSGHIRERGAVTTNARALKTRSPLHEKCLNTHFGLSSERDNTILLVLPDQRFRRRTPGHNGGALVRLQPHLVHLRLCGRGRAQEDRQLPAGDGLQLSRQGSVQSSLVLFHLFGTRSGFDCSAFSGKVTARIVQLSVAKENRMWTTQTATWIKVTFTP